MHADEEQAAVAMRAKPMGMPRKKRVNSTTMPTNAHMQAAQTDDAVGAEVPGHEQGNDGERHAEDDFRISGLTQHFQQGDEGVAHEGEEEQAHAGHARER